MARKVSQRTRDFYGFLIIKNALKHLVVNHSGDATGDAMATVHLSTLFMNLMPKGDWPIVAGSSVAYAIKQGVIAESEGGHYEH